ncbi:betaine/proline/choline family ABC transporter ATP-binding protein (plasmid) [Fusobacteria bacterium ZRK30]|nr:betaine/proline/choline family ABC transporter ATP-binding protein [Fusobacteria bacterium ZRK30]
MIKLKNVVKNFEKTEVIKNVSIDFENGKFYCLIGESGCGKTTLMKLINKLIESSSGEILIDGKDINDYNPVLLRQKIGYVIQKVGLFPHMTIGENIEIVPSILKWDKNKAKERTLELLELMDLDETYYNRYPEELSGGQQQRIGIARALAIDPDIILMDEPFSALDPITRENLQDELISLQEKLKKTIIFVTHDMDEALKLADKIAILKEGEILQFDTPENILNRPKNSFVEYFIGNDRLWKTPEMLLVKDIMKTKIPTVLENSHIARAYEKMKNYEIDAVFVIKKIGKKEKVQGIITKKLIFHRREILDENTKITDLMYTKFISLDERENLLDVLNKISDTKLKVFPVNDEEGNLIGAITPSNLLNVISDITPSIAEVN